MTVKILIPIAIAAVVSLIVGFLRRRPIGGSTMHGRYLLQLLQLVVILLCAAQLLQVIDPTLNIKSIVLAGSALIVAILGFAAQPVIADIICGLLISIHKPFEIGDRIIVEGQQPGIVEDLTLRHTVLRIYDEQRIIIPNSEMNSKTVTNTSYRMKDRRGIHLQFAVSYDTDMQKAMDIIRDCVVDSPYAFTVETDGIREDSGPVYFLKFGDSSLILDTTIWVSRETNTYKAVTDVNLRVLDAFRLHGIEIPFPSFNIMEYEGKQRAAEATAAEAGAAMPARRSHWSNTVHMEPGENRLQEALATVRAFAERQRMSQHAATQLELLMEESFGFVQRVAEQTERDFWIEGTGLSYRIHIRFPAKVGSEEYKKLLELSSGRNKTAGSFAGRVWEAVLMGLRSPADRERSARDSYEWRLSDAGATEEEIGKSILGALADDIRVSVISEQVELIVAKSCT